MTRYVGRVEMNSVEMRHIKYVLMISRWQSYICLKYILTMFFKNRFDDFVALFLWSYNFIVQLMHDMVALWRQICCCLTSVPFDFDQSVHIFVTANTAAMFCCVCSYFCMWVNNICFHYGAIYVMYVLRVFDNILIWLKTETDSRLFIVFLRCRRRVYWTFEALMPACVYTRHYLFSLVIIVDT